MEITQNQNRNLSLSVLKTTHHQLTHKTRELNIHELCKRFDTLFFRNNNSTPRHFQLALGAVRKLETFENKGSLSQLQEFIQEKSSRIFGCMGYDLKNQIEHLSSKNKDSNGFPDISLFEPELYVEVIGTSLKVERSTEAFSDHQIDELIQLLFSSNPPETDSSTTFSNFISLPKTDYLKAVKKLQQHIQAGDIYEVNFCTEFVLEGCMLDPAGVFRKLNQISEAPFASFFRSGNHYLLSSSPERYLQRSGDRLIAQPIKGTSRRSQDPDEDATLRKQLREDPKERSENIMIVDLVRNDLSRIAKKGSVKVDELCGVYPFRQVNQLISTVSCNLRPEVTFKDILQATFPMGSMTGAPKISAMQLIEETENFKRGIYSGTIGMFEPNGDFDLSVVIRSIIYHEELQTVCFAAGSAITARSQPEAEYVECLLKAKGMLAALGLSLPTN